MSGPQPPSSQQVKRQKAAGGCRVKVYLHAVTDAQAELLTDVGRKRPLEEISKKTGTDIEFDPYTSPVPGMKIVIIRGVPSKIEMVVRLIHQVTGAQDTLSAQAQTFWLQWVEAAYPDLESRAYFLPPVYFNSVPMTRQSVGGQNVLVLQSAPGQAGQCNKQGMAPLVARQVVSPQPPRVQDSDVRDDAAMERVLICVQEMSQQNKEVLVGLSQLKFGQYLGEPCYSAAVAQLPVALSPPSCLPRNWSRDWLGTTERSVMRGL
ncbi:uncharacterized protein LOC112554946 [Pomacea canaliculata]|uniref:uncharacterized protein LOC112554946 n=1 Tax=Pomacea canaliculata TaxID=400727 RepID=UPI000D732FC2|nr:uncharacterized protein LOC112554946 [Pomacea canaliculata]